MLCLHNHGNVQEAFLVIVSLLANLQLMNAFFKLETFKSCKEVKHIMIMIIAIIYIFYIL